MSKRSSRHNRKGSKKEQEEISKSTKHRVDKVKTTESEVVVSVAPKVVAGKSEMPPAHKDKDNRKEAQQISEKEPQQISEIKDAKPESKGGSGHAPSVASKAPKPSIVPMPEVAIAPKALSSVPLSAVPQMASSVPQSVTVKPESREVKVVSSRMPYKNFIDDLKSNKKELTTIKFKNINYTVEKTEKIPHLSDIFQALQDNNVVDILDFTGIYGCHGLRDRWYFAAELQKFLYNRKTKDITIIIDNNIMNDNDQNYLTLCKIYKKFPQIKILSPLNGIQSDVTPKILESIKILDQEAPHVNLNQQGSEETTTSKSKLSPHNGDEQTKDSFLRYDTLIERLKQNDPKLNYITFRYIDYNKSSKFKPSMDDVFKALQNNNKVKILDFTNILQCKNLQDRAEFITKLQNILESRRTGIEEIIVDQDIIDQLPSEKLWTDLCELHRAHKFLKISFTCRINYQEWRKLSSEESALEMCGLIEKYIKSRVTDGNIYTKNQYFYIQDAEKTMDNFLKWLDRNPFDNHKDHDNQHIRKHNNPNPYLIGDYYYSDDE